LENLSVSMTFVSDLAVYDPEESHRFLFLLTLYDTALFGPNDAAFEAVSDVLATLTTEELLGVLATHAVVGEFPASVVMAVGCVELPTLAGGMVGVSYDETTGLVSVNGATVVEADVSGEGGTMHGVDSVLGDFTPCPATDDDGDDDYESFLDLAGAAGDYNTLLFALLATPDVIEAVGAALPVSKSFAC
jgi:transforming growth factor-beta-induced protein